ncbi:MAG: hypothetical protein K2N94_03010, partial [Lachnospiraceae bacterium]|nr:hypothetical protein [Lachnospiraceae bacterium]
MDIKTTAAMLTESAESRGGKYIPWWEDDFEHCEYQNHIFTAEEIRQVEECVRECGVDALSAPAGKSGYTLFHLLVWYNFYEVAKKALEDGVDANLTDKKGKGVTPLLLSCCRGNLAMTRLLLDHGADASCRDVKGRNCYHYLAHPYAEGMEISEDFNYSLNQRKAIAELLAGEADINRSDQQGIPPIVYLVDGGSRQICCALIDTFLEKGASPYFVDEGGGTLLLRAIVRQRSTAALRLMEYKELVNQMAQRGMTPLSAAMDCR